MYKDVSRVFEAGQHSAWSRLSVDKIDDWVQAAKEANSQHIFTTIQTFTNSEPTPGEEVHCDFYSDFDGETALNDVFLMAKWFMDNGLSEEYVKCWFSGSRGFHLVVSRKVFGVLPSPDMHKYWKSLGYDISKRLKLRSWDSTVYSCRRMWRVENTKHGKTGLYKIPFTVEELSLTNINQVRELAKREQGDHFEDYVGSPLPKLQQAFSQARERYENSQVVTSWESSESVAFGKTPPCIAKLLSEGVLQIHCVNMTMFRLAAFFKSQGETIKNAMRLMYEWVHTIKPGVTEDLNSDGTVDIKALQRQAQQVCQAVYSGANYGFSCAGILQIPGLRDSCTEECKEMVEGKMEVSLFDAFDVGNFGHRLYIEAEVVGRRDSSMAIPEEITVFCEPSGSTKCADCPLYGSPRGLTTKITAKQDGMLSLIEPSNIPLIGRVAKIVGVPPRTDCHKWGYKIKHRNCDTLYLSPKITNEFEDNRYTRQSAYYFGHGLIPNQGYTFTGFIHKTDKTNVMRLVLDGAVPLSDALSSFEFTDEMKEQSTIFRPSEGQSLEEKHDDIIEALNYNIIRVWERATMIKAIDLAFHSVKEFNFQRELISGWLDVLLIGDTGQGKTKSCMGLMQHYDLGTRISGESASRTGLLYTIATNEKEPNYIIWGAMPRHSGRIIMIDEIQSLVESGGFAELTDARAAGEVTVARTVFGKAETKTRCIWMTNTVGRKSMRSYGFPVLAITDLIPHREDIRRFTFAIGVMSSQVDDALINVNIDFVEPVDNPFTKEVCHNHLLWVWNLTPDKIIIETGVEDIILRLTREICSIYTPTIPLVEPGDFRHKLARVACAIAARMDSRDGNKLIITQQCAEYAYDFFNGIYSESSLKYKQYSDDYAEYALTDEEMVTVAQNFAVKYPTIWKPIAMYVLVNLYSKPKDVSSISGFEEKEIRNAFGWLSAHKLLETTARASYRKTELGTRFLEAVLPREDKESYKAKDVLRGKKDEF